MTEARPPRLVASLVGLALASAPLLAQDSPTELSNREARRIVEAGVAALGGPEAIQASETFSYALRGTSWQLFANVTELGGESRVPDHAPRVQVLVANRELRPRIEGERARSSCRRRSSRMPCARPQAFDPSVASRSAGIIPRPLRVELVEGGQRVFETGGRRVELYDVGPTPHAKEMLVAYLPAERILFQSDLFNPVTPGGPEPIAYDDPWHGVDAEDTRHLPAFIREKALDVERIVGSHGRIGSMTELAEAAGEAR